MLKKTFFSKLAIRHSSSDSNVSTAPLLTELSPQEIRENVGITRNNLEMAKESLDLSLEDYKQQCDTIVQRALSHEQRSNYIRLTNETGIAIRQVNQTRQEMLVPREGSVSGTGLIEAQADKCNTTLKKRFLDQADNLIQESGVSLSRRENQIRQEYHGDLQDLSTSYDRAYIEHINCLKELRTLGDLDSFSTNPEPVTQDNLSGDNPTGNGTANIEGASNLSPSVQPTIGADNISPNAVSAANTNTGSIIDDYADPNLETQDFNDPDS